jgi:hypothetical protein
LSAFVVQLTQPKDNAQRLIQIQQLARGVYLSAIIALLLGPIAASNNDAISTVDQVGIMVAWADTPPGPPDHPMVAAAARSFQMCVERHLGTLSEGLSRSLASQTLPSQLPSNQRRAAALRLQLGTIQPIAPDVANQIITTLCSDAQVPLDGDNPGDAEWARKVIESVYRTEVVTKGFRSMGVKVGFIGPDKGAGSPRFLCETPLLGTIVAGICPPNGIDFEGFVDLARERLGIVFGPGTRDDIVERVGVWDSIGIGRKQLVQNQEALRHRMIRAGLAREYSDGHTEVLRDA